jgi:MoaA/NifB/PqqE/SkfB family radical SAM enzyme
MKYGQRAFALSQPLSALLELTYRCNWRCVFCYNPRHKDLRGLAASDWERILSELRALGTMTVTLTGGEPLTHPEFFEIAGSARNKGFAIRIFTNGSLINEERADRIAALLPTAVELSLHGSTPEVHDAATQKPGSFHALLRGVELLVSRGVRCVLKTPLTRLNEHQIEEMIGLASQSRVPYRMDPSITPRDDGNTTPLGYAMSPEGLRRFMKMSLNSGALKSVNREEGGSNCGLGRSTLAIDPEGNVYPCAQWRHQALGNVREMSLPDMWKSSVVRKEAASIAVQANDMLMNSGDELSSFNFCPALAFQETGDPLTPDESFKARAQAAAEARREDASGIV